MFSASTPAPALLPTVPMDVPDPSLILPRLVPVPVTGPESFSTLIIERDLPIDGNGTGTPPVAIECTPTPTSEDDGDWLMP